MSESKKSGSQQNYFPFLKIINTNNNNNSRPLASPVNKKLVSPVDADQENLDFDLDIKIKKKSSQKNLKKEDNLNSTPKKTIDIVPKEENSLKRKSEIPDLPDQRKILQEEKKDNSQLKEKKISTFFLLFL